MLSCASLVNYEVYMFGGLSQHTFNDLRRFPIHEITWSVSRPATFSEHDDLVGRFAHSMDTFK